MIAKPLCATQDRIKTFRIKIQMINQMPRTHKRGQRRLTQRGVVGILDRMGGDQQYLHGND
jgi:hypothetical protein